MEYLLRELQKAFKELNRLKFDDRLPSSIINIIPKRRNIKGGCSAKPKWIKNIDGKEYKYYEIFINSLLLDNEYEEIIGILLHQMVHLNNKINKIKDCNKKIHNEDFKKQAEKVGFVVEEIDGEGYSDTQLSDALIKEIQALNINTDIFTLHLKAKQKGKAPATKPTYKYQCPKCKKIVKTQEQELLIKCCDCGLEFALQQ